MSIKPSNDSPTPTDWETLGLKPGASAAEVHRAYRHRHSLYSPDSLATYGLIDDGERSERLQQLDAAYRRIISSAEVTVTRPTPVSTPSQSDRPAAASPSTETLITAEEIEHPGSLLRKLRISKGLTLEDLSMETKIRAGIISTLEEEEFGALPEPVFTRGFVIQLSRTLGIRNPDDLAKRYLEMMQEARKLGG